MAQATSINTITLPARPAETSFPYTYFIYIVPWPRLLSQKSMQLFVCGIPSLTLSSHHSRTLPNELWDRVMKFSPHVAILNMLATCKHLNAIASAHLRLQFRPENYLCGFLGGSEITAMLTLQAHTGLVVAGSCVLTFLLRLPNEKKELSLYVNEKFHSAAISFFLDLGYILIKQRQYHGGRGKLPGVVEADSNPHETTHHISLVVSFARGNYIIRLVVVRHHTSIFATIVTFRASKPSNSFTKAQNLRYV
jgi:hypothetical protein